MGIQIHAAELVRSLPLPKGFSVCELGDQGMCGLQGKLLAKDWYEQDLKCGRYVSIDGNGRGTMMADLNRPVTLEPLELGFDLVTDFGTGEHIFDQAQVWRTMHNLTKPGGFIVVDRPSKGYEKHCFYLINDLVYRDVAESNDYSLTLFRTSTKRGELLTGLFRKGRHAPFKVPNQGRYKGSLSI